MNNIKRKDSMGRSVRVKHGYSKTSIYKRWAAMKNRCTNEADPQFKDYGERGITVCERWEVFENFLADMGLPGDGMTLERIDNNLGYCPSNCRWASRQEQAVNRRRVATVIVDGISRPVCELAVQAGMSIKAVHKRLQRGWTVEQALGIPLGRGNPRRTRVGAVRYEPFTWIG